MWLFPPSLDVCSQAASKMQLFQLRHWNKRKDPVFLLAFFDKSIKMLGEEAEMIYKYNTQYLLGLF